MASSIIKEQQKLFERLAVRYGYQRQIGPIASWSQRHPILGAAIPKPLLLAESIVTDIRNDIGEGDYLLKNGFTAEAFGSYGLAAINTATIFLPIGEGINAMRGEILALRGEMMSTRFLPQALERGSVINLGDELVAPTAAEEFTTLYHGTSTEWGASIRANGIDLSWSRIRIKTDFGQGFYTSQSYEQAMGKAVEVAAREGGSPTVLEFRILNSDLANLNGLEFPAANPLWEQFVFQNRSGAPLHVFDYISGPTLRKPEAFLKGASAASFGQQTSFHTKMGIDLLNSSLMP